MPSCGGGSGGGGFGRVAIKLIESYPSVSLTSNSHLPGPIDINCSRKGQQRTIPFLLNPIRHLSAAFGVCKPRSEAASRQPTRTVNKKLAASKIYPVIRRISSSSSGHMHIKHRLSLDKGKMTAGWGKKGASFSFSGAGTFGGEGGECPKLIF